MKQNINFYQFRDAFQSIRPDNFTYEGLSVLFDYLTELEDSTEQEIELDVIALCCEYSESTCQQIANDYSINIETDDMTQEVKDYLNDHTCICGELEDGQTIIFQQF